MLIGWRKRAGGTVRRLRGLRQEHVQPSGQSDALALQPPSCTEEELHSVLSLVCYDWRTNQTVCLCANRCWLSTENNFIWSFIGPACLIILVRLERRPSLTPLQDTRLHFYVFFFFFCLYFSPQVNLLAFGVIIYKVYRHTAVKKPEISHYENIR